MQKIMQKTINIIKLVSLNSLVISGGGMRGFLYLGAIKYLFEHNVIKKIKFFYGTSFGGIIATCICLGWSWEQIYKFAIGFPIDCMIEYNIDNFIENYGLIPKTNYETLFKKLILFKQFSENITFAELYAKTSKELHLMTYSLTENKTIDLNFKSTPNLKIWEGLYMTSALPILVQPYEYQNNIYIDGGITENFPINYVKPENIHKTIGIYSDFQTNDNSFKEHFKTKNFVNYLEYSAELIKLFFSKNIVQNPTNCIKLNFNKNSNASDTFNFTMTKQQRIDYINEGLDQTNNQIEDVIKTIIINQLNNHKKLYTLSPSKYNEI